MSEKVGFVFDWDGVVVDSSKQHEKSWELLAEAEGLSLFDGHFKLGFGKKNQFIIPNILKWTNDLQEIERLSLEKERFYRQIVRETGLAPLPGVSHFLNTLATKNLHRVVGSSTPRKNIDTVLQVIGLEGIFEHIVSADDVGKGKPDPEVFLKAAERIGVPPERCIVFEDSLSGIEAGLAASMTVVGIATTNPPKILQEAGVALVANSFEALTPEKLITLIRT